MRLLPFLGVSMPAEAKRETSSKERLQRLFEADYDFVWRFIRRLGVPLAAVDDAAQDAFVVVARRMDEIRSGSERAFLFSTALRVAADARRAAQRSGLSDANALERVADGTVAVDERIDLERARALCDRVLDTMPLELRAVFVLSQVEAMTMAEIATCLDIPPGTVASRIRRARAHFDEAVARASGGAR